LQRLFGELHAGEVLVQLQPGHSPASKAFQWNKLQVFIDFTFSSSHLSFQLLKFLVLFRSTLVFWTSNAAIALGGQASENRRRAARARTQIIDETSGLSSSTPFSKSD
jgi:hypothetical protein